MRINSDHDSVSGFAMPRLDSPSASISNIDKPPSEANSRAMNFNDHTKNVKSSAPGLANMAGLQASKFTSEQDILNKFSAI